MSNEWDEAKQEWGYVYEMASRTKCWMYSPGWVNPKDVKVTLLATRCGVDEGVVLADFKRG